MAVALNFHIMHFAPMERCQCSQLVVKQNAILESSLQSTLLLSPEVEQAGAWKEH